MIMMIDREQNKIVVNNIKLFHRTLYNSETVVTFRIKILFEIGILDRLDINVSD
jgi:hypothetical protein